ncbi:Piwi domain-containing protein [Boletus edulis]|nr:Piwi domain-containing protein [Boletus edulis]
MSNPNRGGPRGRGRGGHPRGGGGGTGGGTPPRTGSPSGYSGRGGFRGGRGGGAGPPGAGVSGGAVFGGPPSVDQRLSPNNVNALIQTLKTIPHDPARPTRPGFGTLGKAGVLRANFFPIKFSKGVMYDYHVEITPKTDLKNIRARLFTLLEQSTHPGWHKYVPFIAHDGSARLVSSKKLPEPLDVPVLFLREGQTTPTERDKTYTLSITFTQELPASQLDALINANPDSRNYDFAPLVGAYNLVLQHHASHNGVRVGKNRYFFPSDGRPLELSIGVEAWRGFFMSARPVFKELMVNVGVCMTAFYKAGNLADAMMEFQRQSKGAMLQRFAQKLKVTTSHLGYRQTKPLRAIASTNAKQTSFQCDEFNAKLSVADYFKKKYNKTLRHPELPVVNIAGPNSKHPIYVPPELCEILPGQPFRGKLDDQQTTEMLRFACKRPPENAHAILNQGFPLLGLTSNNQTLSNFGLEVSNNMAGVPFRELPPPNVSYKGGQPPRVNNGSWNILDVQFRVSGVVKSWWILVVADPQSVFKGPDDPQLIGLWKGFAGKCQRSGMTGIDPGRPPNLVPVKLENPATDPARQRSLAIIRSTIRDNQARLGTPSFMLVILSKRDNYIYPGIKRICDVELGIHTIHMLANKVLSEPRKQDQYFSNVALKVNTKLGGVNHKVDDGNMKWLTKTKTMLVGMDVTHPGPGSIEGTPSIAAVVASVDNNFAQFPASLRCQKSKQEMITDLSEMMIERLKRYQEVSKTFPDRIYVFRDGVSEGQFDTVLEEELPKLLDAFKRVNPKGGPQGKPYRPQLTIVICGKRHHVRNWPADATADKNGNTRPGTVVDQGITAVFDFDFYLQAHAGLQGHVKPTHYTVIYDESRVGVDEVQQGINTASYLYARATRSVSLIPPAYYADLACERGRCYLNDFLVSEDKTTTTSKGKSSKMDREEEKERVYQAAIRAWGNGIHPNMAGSMFYI